MVVIPKTLRDRVGLVAGAVEVVVDAAGLRISPIAEDLVVDRDGILVVPSSGHRLDDEALAALRRADQR